MPHYAVQTQEIFSKSEQYRKWEGGGNGVGSWGQQKQSGCPTQTIKVSWVPGKPAPLWLSSWGCSSPLELGRSALPFKKGTCKWNSHSAMTLDVQCGRLSLIHVQVHTTHSWLRACLSCPLTPITSQNSAACSPWQCFDMSTEPLQGHQPFLVPEHTYFKKVSFNSLWLWLHHFSTLKPETKRHWYLLYSYDLQSPESPHGPFTSIALSEKDEGSMCPGNWVIASPSHILFTERLPGPQPSAAWIVVCVLWYLSHTWFGQFESHDPGPHDLGEPNRGWPTIL